MAHWLPFIIGIVVAIALPLAGIFYAKSNKSCYLNNLLFSVTVY